MFTYTLTLTGTVNSDELAKVNVSIFNTRNLQLLSHCAPHVCI